MEGVGGQYGKTLDACCDVCNSSMLPSDLTLNFSEPCSSVTQRKRRRAVRKISDAMKKTLKARLQSERDAYLKENPGFGMIGASFVCPDATIDEICNQAKFTNSVDDIILFGVRSVLKERFFNVILDVCDYVPCEKNSRLL